jgi:hypothetical protein
MPSWPEFNPIEWVILISLSLFLPISIFFGRGNIRKRRLRALLHLQEKVFEAAPGRSQFFKPFFELVIAKYEQDRVAPKGTPQDGPRKMAKRYALEFVAYFPPTTIFVILSAMGIYLVLASLNFTFEVPNLLMLGLSYGQPGDQLQRAAYQTATALIVAAGFLGSYIWSINYLILRVANFDLTPLDFLRVSAHILLTTLLAGVLRHFAGAATGLDLTAAAVFAIAFLMGLFPSLGLTTLVDRLPSNLRLKRVIPQANQISRELPLDLIDGVDSGIKFRLGNYEINDAQILATTNPISLYVSTPYGLLQILDWISQAQLLIAIGPANYLEARKYTIRGIHDLLDFCSTPAGRKLAQALLFPVEVSDDVMSAKLESLRRPPYVQLLLGLWDLTAPYNGRVRPAAEENDKLQIAA